MIKKLRFSFVCMNMAIILVMLVVILSAVFRITKINLEQNTEVFMKQMLTAPYIVATLNNSVEHPYFIFEVDASGNILIVNAGSYETPDLEEVQVIFNQIGDSQTGTLDSFSLRYYGMSINNRMRYVFVDISHENSVANDLIWSLIGVGLIGLCAFLVISIFLSKWVVRPVTRAWEHQKVFISDASHELKTPLTVISANAEMIRYDKENMNLLEQRIDNICASANQMQDLTKQLLLLAQTEDHTRLFTKTKFNISNVLRMEILSFEALFFEKDITVHTDIMQDIIMFGDEDAVRQLVRIYLDNAYKYSDNQSVVEVCLKRLSGKQTLLSVSNVGDPIPKDKLDTIFHRFYRTDASRSEKEGYGLGLAIASAIASAHHAKVWAENSGDKNVFFLKF